MTKVLVSSPTRSVLVAGGGPRVVAVGFPGSDAWTWRGKLLDPASFTAPPDGAIPLYDAAADTWYAMPFSGDGGSGGGGGPVLWTDIVGTPTTIDGYGITDAYTIAEVDALLAGKSNVGHTHSFASITAKPTTLAGYGILDAYTKTESDARYAATAHTHTAADITGGTFGAGAFKFPAGLTVVATTALPLRIEFDANRYAELSSDSFGSFNFKTFGPGDTSVNFFARYFGTYDGQVIITGPGPGTGYQLEIYDGDSAWTDFEADPLGLLITPNPAGGNVRIVGAGLSVANLATFAAGATGILPTQLTGWPVNAAGVLTNNGTGTLTWGAVAWGSITGVPATFPPSAHVHPFTDLTGTLAYAQLPTGGGTWANGGALNITGGAVTVASLVSTGTVSAGTGAFITGPAGTGRALVWQTAGVARFSLGISATAEGGGNAGSNFFLSSLDDAGAAIDQVWSVVRAANGVFTISRPVVLGGTMTSASGFAWRTISTVNATASAQAALMQVGGVIVEAASGTHPLLAGIRIEPLSVTAGVASVTEAANLWVGNAPTVSGATTYAIHVGTGTSRFEGDIVIPSGQKIYPDGGGDSYWSEAAPNDLRWVVGGGLQFGITSSGPYVPALTFLALSGPGGNSGIRETSAGSVDLIAAGSIVMRFNAAAGGSAVSFGSLAVLPTAKLFFDGGSDHYAYEAADNILDFYSNANTHQVRIDGATALADGDTCLFVRRRAAGADSTNRIQWKAFSALAAGDKVLIVA